MKNKASKIANYHFMEGEEFLLDANVWLYLFPAPSSAEHYATRVYSAAFKFMKDARSKILINALVLSEYLNRYCRIEWKAMYAEKYSDYKSFRQSSDYNEIGESATAFAKIILKNSIRVNDNFDQCDASKIISEFEAGRLDFNDSLLTDVCSRKSWKLITHDGDFSEGGIEILTANARLMAACQ